MQNKTLSKNEILEKFPHGIETDFMTEIDSWFSTDIACCFECVNDYLEYWPLAYEANDAEFQKNSMETKYIYESTILKDLYTEEEFDVLIDEVHCPRCHASFKDNMIWPYDLPFLSDIDTFEFECKIEEITTLSQTTPFLLLKNKFASEVHDILHSLYDSTKSINLEQTLYRARISTQVSKLHYDEFKVAPKKFIGEGRYNHAGEQVLYLASDMETCFNEIGKELCYIAEINISKEIKILDLTEPYEAHQEHEDILNALIFSALMSKQISTTGYNKPAYIFSRFIADCAKSAQFDAIKYPSTKAMKENYNLVIINKDIYTNNTEFNNLYLFDGNTNINLKINT